MVVVQIEISLDETGAGLMPINILAREDATDKEIKAANYLQNAILAVIQVEVDEVATEEIKGNGHDKIRKEGV
jgi:hypothetical protein